MILGIDFGTCFSLIAVKNNEDDNLVKCNHIPGCDSGVPTVFGYSSGQPKYGFDCRNEREVIKYIKKIIRENPTQINRETISIGDKSFSASHILKGFLDSIIRKTIAGVQQDFDIINQTVVEAVAITAPVGIANGQMLATEYNALLKRTVKEITGLSDDKVYVLEEPVAGAISYLQARGDMSRNQTVLVFDLGGGTLDVSIVKYDSENQSFRVCAKEGDSNLGGNDWDNALKSLVLRKIDRSNPIGVEEITFNNKITDLKISLSTNESEDFMMQWDGDFVGCKVSREEFESVSNSLLDSAISVVRRTLSSYDGRIDKIVLTGGGSNMPQIKNRMITEFGGHIGGDNILIGDPSRAIARGAAIYAKMVLDNKIATGEFVNTASHTYGVDCYNRHQDKDMINNILYKGTLFSAGVIETDYVSYYPLKNDQKNVGFTVYESDSLDHWSKLENGEKNGMKVVVDVPSKYYEKKKSKSYRIEAKFKLSQDGILELKLKDVDGKQIGYTKKQV